MRFIGIVLLNVAAIFQEYFYRYFKAMGSLSPREINPWPDVIGVRKSESVK